MLNLRTGKNDLAPVALTRRDSIKGLAAILAAGCAPAIASAAARGAGGRVRGAAAAAAAAAAAYDYYDGVEYLTADGNQRINTEYYPNQDTTDEFKARGCQTFAGCHNGSSWSMAFSLIVLSSTVSGGNDMCSPRVGNSPLTSYVNLSFDPNVGSHVYSVGFDTYADGVLVRSYTPAAYQMAYPLIIFDRSMTDHDAAKGDLYYLKVFESGTTIRHFVPVVHEGEGKMLDLVHNTLYSNAGTGSFTVGPSKGVIAVPKQGFGANTPSI